MFRCPLILSGFVLLLLLTVGISWWMYAVYFKPDRDLRMVEEAMTILEVSPQMSNWHVNTKDYSDERRLILLSALFRDESLGVPKDIGIQSSRAALDLAIHNGSKEARLVLGKALRDGTFGEKDPRAALAQFRKSLTELQPGIQTGDEDALYVQSLMLKEGLGVKRDSAKAREILKRVAMSRDYATMRSIGITAVYSKAEDRDLEFGKAISRKLIEKGHPDEYRLAASACFQQHLLIPKELKRCRLPFAQAAAEKGNQEAIEDLASLNLAGSSRRGPWEKYAPPKSDLASSDVASSSPVIGTFSFEDAMRPSGAKQKPSAKAFAASPEANKNEWGDQVASAATPQAVKPPSFIPFNGELDKPASPPDPEVQTRTGYLNGTTQIAKGGLSSFKVDNTKGGGDAVVRLYRDGKKPAVRSMFAKNGESFSANSVVPGSYRMRYRYIGSADTFEAEETFVLSETRTDTGTRFSRMTVTLFKVANGNMTVKKVDASEF